MLTLVALVVAVLWLTPPWSLALVAGAAVIDLAETGALFLWSRRRRRLCPPAAGVETIVGRPGIALGRLDRDRAGTSGQVRVDGEIWGARARGPIDPGTPVTVTAVDGLVLWVEPTRRS